MLDKVGSTTLFLYNVTRNEYGWENFEVHTNLKKNSGPIVAQITMSFHISNTQWTTWLDVGLVLSSCHCSPLLWEWWMKTARWQPWGFGLDHWGLGGGECHIKMIYDSHVWLSMVIWMLWYVNMIILVLKVYNSLCNQPRSSPYVQDAWVVWYDPPIKVHMHICSW